MSTPSSPYPIRIEQTTPQPSPPANQFPLAGLAYEPLTDGSIIHLEPLSIDCTLVLGSAFDKRQLCKLVLTSQDKTWSFLLNADYCSIGQRFHIDIPAGVESIHVSALEADTTLWVLADNQRLPNSLPMVWPHLPGIDRLARFYDRLENDCVAEFGWMGGCVLEAYHALMQTDAERWSGARDRWLANFLDDQHLTYQDPHGRQRQDEYCSIETTLPIATVARLNPQHPIVPITMDYLAGHAAKDASCEGCYTVAYPIMQIAAIGDREDLRQQALAELQFRRRELVVGDAIYLRHFSSQHTFRNWSRGVAWYLLGYAECIRLSDRQGDWQDAANHLAERAAWALAHQREDGLWSNFFHEPMRPADTAGSAGIAAALIKTEQLGLIGPEATVAANRCWDALLGKLHVDGWLSGTSRSNKRTEAIQHSDFRTSETFGMGLMGLLAGEITGG